MSFLSPIWLVGLVPWAGLAIWMLVGQRRRADVPFLQLWQGPEPLPKAKRALRAPPFALLLVLLAILLSILAAAGPAVRNPIGRSFTLIIDRGVNTSARYVELLMLGKDAVQSFGLSSVDLVLVPEGAVIRTDSSDWIGIAHDAGSSSLDTTSLLRAAASDALIRNDWPVIVLTNAKVEFDDPRIVRVTLPNSAQNVGIIRIAAREVPQPQVMVSVRNSTALGSAELSVTSGGQTRSKTISLGDTPAEQTHFIDVPALGQVVQVTVSAAGDELPADNTAWLVRQRVWPRIETRMALTPELERMVQVYAKHRPAGEGALRVAITDRLDLTEPAVIVAPRAVGTIKSDVPLTVAPHAIAQHVNWKPMPDVKLAPAPGAGWQPVVSAGDRVLVAVREVPARQVWVGFTSDGFARTADFVAFWTNVFDWTGQGGGRFGGEQFIGERARMPGPEWRRRDDLSGGAPLPIAPAPGVYGREDGTLRALNVLDVRIPPAPTAEPDWRAGLQQLNSHPAGLQQLRRPALFAALGAVVLASLVWGRSGASPKAVST